MNVNLSEKDIISTYAGYRPLVKPRNTSASTAKLSRSHVVLQSSSGLVTVTGGKLTTYRRMAQDAVDVLSKRDGARVIHPTKALPLQGSAGWQKIRRILEQRGAKLGLSAPSIEHLNHSYGTMAQTILDIIEEDPSLATQLIDDLPYLKAEVIYACRYEMAITPDDILAHRTSIVLEDKQAGAGILDEVSRLMEKELGSLPGVRKAERLRSVQQAQQIQSPTGD
jgi:glycerol-3-phosphate dehydrogenase